MGSREGGGYTTLSLPCEGREIVSNRPSAQETLSNKQVCKANTKAKKPMLKRDMNEDDNSRHIVLELITRGF